MIKILVPVLAASYLAFIWAPETRGLAAPYVIASLIGAASFSLVPIVLEYLVEITYPASPEVGSVLCWAGGQLLGGIFIVIMNSLKDGVAITQELEKGESVGDRPVGNMHRALIFQAVVAIVVVPCAMVLGVKRLGLGEGNVSGRLRVDEHREDGEEGGG